MDNFNNNQPINSLKKPWYKKWWGVIIILILLVFFSLAAAFGFYIMAFYKKIKSGELSEARLKANIYANLDSEAKEKIEGQKSYWQGKPTAEITIVEFGDFNCPLCRQSFPTIKQVLLKNKETKLIFRHYPLISENSLDLALAAECAGEQGLFWPMHDKLFSRAEEAADTEALAKEIGADPDKFKTCLTEEKYLSKIQKDITDAEELQVKGTPTWFVNGSKVSGDVPAANWESIIKELTP